MAERDPAIKKKTGNNLSHVLMLKKIISRQIFRSYLATGNCSVPFSTLLISTKTFIDREQQTPQHGTRGLLPYMVILLDKVSFLLYGILVYFVSITKLFPGIYYY